MILDASALLAFLLEEPGADAVSEALRAGATISAVNWAEVLSWFAAQGEIPEEVTERLAGQGLLGQLLEVRPFCQDDGLLAARLRPLTRALGLSLGDRACLALALHLDQPVLTADRAWQTLDLGVQIQVVR